MAAGNVAGLSESPGQTPSNGALAVPLARGEPAVTIAVAPREPAATRAAARPAKRPRGIEFDPVALALGVLVALRGETHTSLLTAALLIAGYPVAVLWLLWRRPARWDDGSLLDELRRLVVATSTAALVLIGTDAIVSGPADVSLGLRIWVCTVALLCTGRVSLHHLRGRLPLAGRPMLIVGAGRVGAELARHLRAEPQHGLCPVGFLEYRSEQPTGTTPLGLPLLGTPDELEATIARTGAECVAFAFPVSSDERLLPLIEQCEGLGLKTFVVPRLFEALGWRMGVRHVGVLPLGELAPVEPHDVRFAIKHVIDRVVAALLLVTLAPLMAAIAAGVKASSPGPVFFRQRRIGRDGREFTMLKYRTMREAPSRLAPFEPPGGCAPGGVECGDRRTPFGIVLRRASLDELPQLINVLCGQMSLVGPRPERPEYVRRFSAELRRYERRHRVKSGITGLAQVTGLRGQTSILERAEYDNFYVQNWSFWLDFKIAVRTVKVVLALGGE